MNRLRLDPTAALVFWSLACTAALGGFATAPAAAAETEPPAAAAAEPSEPADLTEPSESAAQPGADEELLAGHSAHGEAFNEGPRQAAVLLPGMGDIDYPASTNSERVQALINQGVAALHGFWYLEAERSFRQAAQLQPDLAIAYWGMARANVNNETRARGFISKAKELRDAASDRERMEIDALAKYLEKPEKRESKEDRQKRRKQYLKDLEEILHKYPDEIEARALLALQCWQFRGDLPITSYYAVDALLDKVFAANPLHPAHHYRIHLWDGVRPENALHAAAMCGPSLPAVAHMWHMPGHIYSKLHRYADAAWHQEASARVDHGHMIQARLLPDQIHNFAHNNEWLIRNLIFLGRVDDALEQSLNLIALPRHPRYNSLSKRGSFLYGRMRLLQTLTEYELWDALIDHADGPYLEPTTDKKLSDERLSWLVVAHRLTGDQATAAKLAEQLLDQQTALETEIAQLTEQLDSLDKADRKGDKRSGQLSRAKSRLRELKTLIARGRAAEAVAAKDASAAKEHLEKVGRIDPVLAASWIGQAGDHEEAIKRLKKLLPSRPGQVRPLAVLIDQLWSAGQQDEACERFETLRTVAADADRETPLLARLEPVAKQIGISGDWRAERDSADDIGQRPPLDSLGPRLWQPYTAPDWTASQAEQTPVNEAVDSGKAKLIVFYLGFGCLHCVEQLTALKPKVDQFAAAGIEIIAISTETPALLQQGLKNYGEPLPLTILADPKQQTFRDFRCWDDFESIPLHGTFLIDPSGRVRWQDIGHEPFNEIDFLLQESQRLLALPQ